MKKNIFLLLMLATTIGTTQADQPERPLCERVKPIQEKMWEKPHPTDQFSQDIRYLLMRSCQYLTGAWWTDKKHFDKQEAQDYLDFGGTIEKYIRPIGHAGFTLAFALKSGIYDETIAKTPAEEAKRKTVRLISSMAHRHMANSGKEGWGNLWQSALWAAQGAEAAWIMWDELDTKTRQEVCNMLVFEADRFIDYEVPYYQDATGKILFPGDTKAEENAWNSNITTIAMLMLPDHPHYNLWEAKNYELQLSAYAAPDDRQMTRKIDGRRPCDILKGSNINMDGTVVNHRITHPDYMTAIMHNTTNGWLHILARQPELEASSFNGERVYKALTVNKYNGKTMFLADEQGHATSQVYFPEGNDWGNSRQANYWLMDMMAHLYGWDNGVTPSALDFAKARTATMIQMINRGNTGAYYQTPQEDRFDTREEWFGWHIAFGYMGWWLKH